MKKLKSYKKISLVLFIAYSLLGFLASLSSEGMRDTQGIIISALFILSILAVDIVLVKQGYQLSEINGANLASICLFYFFSLTLPLIFTCPSPLSPRIAFLGFSIITFFPFMLIVWLIKRVEGITSKARIKN
jgi:hypothetical protein